MIEIPDEAQTRTYFASLGLSLERPSLPRESSSAWSLRKSNDQYLYLTLEGTFACRRFESMEDIWQRWWFRHCSNLQSARCAEKFRVQYLYAQGPERKVIEEWLDAEAYNRGQAPAPDAPWPWCAAYADVSRVMRFEGWPWDAAPHIPPMPTPWVWMEDAKRIQPMSVLSHGFVKELKAIVRS